MSTLFAIVLLCVLALAAIATVVVALVVRRRRARRADRPSGITPLPGTGVRGPPLPVVLVHGLFGFDRIGVPGAKLHYFHGIARHLDGLGCHAHAVRLPGAGSVPSRARALVAAIDALGHDRVDVIAHSLGGLDARYALSHLGLHRRVRALVTVGTPHRGTPLADLAIGGGPIDWARRVVRAIGVPLDAPGVRYACVVGGIRHATTPVALALMPAHAYLRRVAGANDGLVPIASQYWGETLAEIEADHFAQIGWRISVRRSFDALGLYAFVVARLGDLRVSSETEPAAG